MGNRISRRAKSSRAGSSTGHGDSFDFRDGTISATSVPKFPDLPNRSMEEEIARQRSEHFLLKHIFQQSYFAPVCELLQDANTVVLDYGFASCGTWVVEMANDFPNPMFYCLDMQEQPNLQDILHVPPNTHFEKANILNGLNHHESSVDFVHQRIMMKAYHGDDIPYVIREMLRLLKPGGWVELVEYDPIPKKAGPLFAKLLDAACAFLKAKYNNFIFGPRLRRYLTDGGFEDIHYDYASIPVCWGGYVGKNMYENVLTRMRFMGPLIYQELFNTDAEFNEAEYDEYVDKAFDECVQYQTFFNVHWAYGKKPSTV